MPDYYVIPTNIGEAKMANALSLGIPLAITELAVGDGEGSGPRETPIPNPEATALVSERRRAPVNSFSVDPDNPNVLIAEQVIPESEGGWWIREMGLFDEDGDMIFVCNTPPTYKPLLSEGSGRTQVVRMATIVSDTAAVTLKVDPSVVLATREYVQDLLSVQSEEFQLGLNKRFINVESVFALANISSPFDGQPAVLSSSTPGVWLFSNEDLSLEVAGDSEQIDYIAIASDPSGASGAWVRKWGAGVEIGDIVQLDDNGGAPALPAVDGSKLTGVNASVDFGPKHNQVPTNELVRNAGSLIRHNFTDGSNDLMSDIQFMDYWGNFVVSTGGTGWRQNTVSDGAFSIVKVAGGYQAYFGGDGSAGIAMMTASTLRGPWTDHGVVLPVGGSDGSVSIGGPQVFTRPGPDKYNMVMFYTYNTSGGPGNRIGFALSSDGGFTWSKNAANPVLQPGGVGAWDEGGVQSASVFWDNDLQKWVMAYSGWSAGSTVTRGSIGIATCDKFGLDNWTKHTGNPVLTPTATDGPEDFGLLCPTIWKEQGTYYLGYAAKRDDIGAGEPFELSSICMASGPDFDSFTRNAANPIIDSRDYANYTELECPQFIKIDDTWHAFCNAYVEDGQIAMFLGVVNDF